MKVDLVRVAGRLLVSELFVLQAFKRLTTRDILHIGPVTFADDNQ